MSSLTTKTSISSASCPAAAHLADPRPGLLTLERVGHLLCKLRQLRGLSQLEFANMAEINPSYYCLVEHGANMSFVYFGKICETLDVQPDLVLMVANSFPDLDEGIKHCL